MIQWPGQEGEWMSETPDQIHGRLNEAMHVAGYFETVGERLGLNAGNKAGNSIVREASVVTD